MLSQFTIPFNTARPEDQTCIIALSLPRPRVLAARAMPKGSVVERSITRQVDDQYWFLWENGLFVFGSGLSQLYNHSDTPNVEVVRDYPNNRMHFFALRDIGEGEELCHRYPDWRRYSAGAVTGAAAASDAAAPAAAKERPLSSAGPMVSDGVEVRPSKIDRMGVFARRPIAAGELVELALVFPVPGTPWFSWRTTEQVFCSGIPHFFAASPAGANVDMVEDHDSGLMDFVLSRDVAAGEELFIGSHVHATPNTPNMPVSPSP